MPPEESNQGFKQRACLLVQSREITADATKGGRPIVTAEGARDLLLNFGHAKISFRLIVGKWDPQVI